jgi:CubicO group peptidase (beta-lactamase class C family)
MLSLLFLVFTFSTFAQTPHQSLESFAFTKSPEGINTDALIISQNGKIIFEKYANGYNKDMRHRAWSMAKTFNAIYFAIAQTQGLLDMNDKISKHLKVPKRFKEITIKNLLQMTSGISWNEGYEASPFKSDIVEMLFLPNGNTDMAKFVLSHKIKAAPGSRYFYSSGDTLLSSAVLKAILRDRYENFPFKEFYEKIGANSVVIEKDNAGNYISSSYMYATPRDMLKIGNFLLNESVINSHKLIKDDIFKFLTSLNYTDGMEYTQKSYGAGVWLNKPIQALAKKRPFPATSEKSYFAFGHNGQMMAIIPEKKMVILRLATDKKILDRNKLLEFSMAGQ